MSVSSGGYYYKNDETMVVLDRDMAFRNASYHGRPDMPKRFQVDRTMMQHLFVGWAIALIIYLTWVSVYDIRTHTIPDRMVIVGLVLSLLIAPFWNDLGLPRGLWGYSTWQSLLNSLLAGGLMVAVLTGITLISPQWVFGVGDIKLAGVAGIIVGLTGSPNFLGIIGAG